MDAILDELERYARRCERMAAQFEADEFKSCVDDVMSVIVNVGRAWSGSFLGYQAFFYKDALKPKRPGEHFDSEWGAADEFSDSSRGAWCEYDPRQLANIIREQAKFDQASPIKILAKETATEFKTVKRQILPLLEALGKIESDPKINTTRDAISKLKSHISSQDFFHVFLPKRTVFHA